MTDRIQPEMQCADFEAVLSEALEGQLAAAERQRFEQHRTSCAVCGPMYAEVELGRRLLRSLEEVEAPKQLVNNILRATIGVAEQPAAAPAVHPETTWERVRHWGRRLAAPILQPRFVMSFGMAFFSISVLLNVAGFKLADLRYVDLRPSALARTYYEAQGRLVKYYENIRFVYEIESRVRQLRNAAAPTPEQKAVPEKQQQSPTQEKRGEPERKDISREETPDVMAHSQAEPVIARGEGHELRGSC